MSGIVGYIGKRNAVDVVVEGLVVMEQLGLGGDSAGIAVHSGNRIKIRKQSGRINELVPKLPKTFKGTLAIAHTRWATHGRPSDRNAHPIPDCNGDLALIHSGLLVNSDALRVELEEEGHSFSTSTDSEVLVHLVEKYYDGNLTEAVRQALLRVEGTYGIAVVHRREPDTIVGASSGSSLIMGVGEGEVFLASDVQVLAAHSLKIYYLRDQEIVTLTHDSFHVSHLTLEPGDERAVDELPETAEETDLGDYSSFFEKEMQDQPNAVQRVLSGRMLFDYGNVKLRELEQLQEELLKVKRIVITGSGSSYMAAMVAANWLQSVARVPTTHVRAGELAGGNPMIETDTLYIAVSQSGETASTIAAVREIKLRGGRVIGICNRISSTLYRETSAAIYTRAGIEYSVPATKSFTTELVAFALLTILLGRMRNISAAAGKSYLRELEKLPRQMEQLLEEQDEYLKLAQRIASAGNYIFLGFGPMFGVAKEAALKVHQMVTVCAQGFSTSEFHHGPIATVKPETPIIMFVPDDVFLERNRQIYSRLLSRDAKVIVITDRRREEFSEAMSVISIPHAHLFGYPVVAIMSMQMLLAAITRELGLNVDQPRHLQKVVNVE